MLNGKIELKNDQFDFTKSEIIYWHNIYLIIIIQILTIQLVLLILSIITIRIIKIQDIIHLQVPIHMKTIRKTIILNIHHMMTFIKDVIVIIIGQKYQIQIIQIIVVFIINLCLNLYLKQLNSKYLL